MTVVIKPDNTSGINISKANIEYKKARKNAYVTYKYNVKVMFKGMFKVIAKR